MDTKELLASLEKDARRISNNDIMKARSFMLNYVKFLPEKYKKAYSTELFSYYYETFMEIKGLRSNPVIEEIDIETYNELVKNYSQQFNEDPLESYFQRFMSVVTPYLIFITKKPLHPVGMILPGGMTIMEPNGEYYCPIKNKQTEVDIALCKYCICKDNEEVVKTDRYMCGKSFRY
ncbi:DUF2115 domain-containing protein [Methanococcoides burtonii]|nr:DUF2115 domain-containing protein [Methanococcoides burtonii]